MEGHEAPQLKAGVPDVASGLVFEFWNDREYFPYGDEQQQVLNEKFVESPRPQEVTLLDRRYLLRSFDAIEHGVAYQVKVDSGYQRRVQLQQPYSIPGAPSGTPLRPDQRFQFLLDIWHDYETDLQRQLATLASNCPPPSQVTFRMRGQAYCLLGLDRLLGVNTGAAVQVNVRSGAVNQVRLFNAMPAPEGSLRATATFRVPGRFFSPQSQAELLEAWLAKPRPDHLLLSDGDTVSHFDCLELGFAQLGIASVPSLHMPVELLLPLPSTGRVVLPDELDSEDSNLEDFGRTLTVQECRDSGIIGTECAICRCDIESDDAAAALDPSDLFQLSCGHTYHHPCIERWFESRKRCPECLKEFGKVFGTQPSVGTLHWRLEDYELPGHRGTKTFVVSFKFPAGVDPEGKSYGKREPFCYLPGDARGCILLELYKVAFKRRVMFGLGDSMAMDTYRPTYNIHIKTSRSRGEAGHGYPDDDYFRRCLEELAANGVTLDDLP